MAYWGPTGSDTGRTLALRVHIALHRAGFVVIGGVLTRARQNENPEECCRAPIKKNHKTLERKFVEISIQHCAAHNSCEIE